MNNNKSISSKHEACSMIYKSPLGDFLLDFEGELITKLTYLNKENELTGKHYSLCPNWCETSDSFPAFLKAKDQLDEYFYGKRKSFTLALKLQSTPFQQRVYAALQSIPYGKTLSYGEVAAISGCPRGARAVGMACHNNPIMLLIPCHRVVGAKGALTGFGAGIPLKKALLELEEQNSTVS